jgi:cytochrome P450
MCIGNRFAMLEMKCALAHLVRKYSFTLDQSKQWDVVNAITMGIKDLFLFVQARA